MKIIKIFNFWGFLGFWGLAGGRPGLNLTKGIELLESLNLHYPLAMSLNPHLSETV